MQAKSTALALQKQIVALLDKNPDGLKLREISKATNTAPKWCGSNLRELRCLGLVGHTLPKATNVTRHSLTENIDRAQKAMDSERAMLRAGTRARAYANQIAAKTAKSYCGLDIDDRPFRHIWIDAKSAPPIRPTGPVWVFGL